jgi:hypothetical protein
MGQRGEDLTLRFVRGALQQIYRALNRTLAEDRIDGPKLAAKVSVKIGLYSPPLYYATPGSLIDRAFQGVLPMIDADRVYERFFASVGVTQLVPGQALTESLHTIDVREACDLQKEICDRLAPFLIAPIIATGRRSNEIETIARRLRERFEVRACRSIDVTFSLNSDPSQARTVSESKFYMRRTRVPRTAGGAEYQFTLYVVTDQEPQIGLLDADALGESLVPLFIDDTVGDWSALFPRVVTRYQAVGGDVALLSEFLLRQLHVSLEAQEEARCLVSAEELACEPPSPPPPALLITAPPLAGSSGPDEQHALEGQIQRQETQVREKAASLIRGLSAANRGGGEGRTHGNGEHHIHHGVTREQQDRGREGEEEIKRRLMAAGGWEEFIFVSDMRDQPCGYDFLCQRGGREVKLEVKTFLLDGRVVVTSNELRESATSRQDYYLVGVLHDGPAASWATVIRQDPLSFLMTHGEFTIEASLEMHAQALWSAETSDPI